MTAKSSGVYEGVMGLNATNAKFAKWVFRVVAPKKHAYSFQCRDRKQGTKKVNAERFDCVLVGDEPTEYAMGSVPFQFDDPHAASRALERFVDGTVWEITRPVFDSWYKTEFNAAPMKQALLLQEPTKIKPVPPTDGNYSKPSRYISPPASLSYILEFAENFSGGGGQASQQDGSASQAPCLAGVGTTRGGGDSRAVDFVAKFVGKAKPKSVTSRGNQLRVMDIDVVDDSQLRGGGSYAKCAISVWNKAIDLFDNVALGSGVVLMGCTLTLGAGGKAKINMQEGGGRILQTGPRVQELTQFESDDPAAFESVTAVWSAGPPNVDGEARLTCAAAMLAHVPSPWQSEEANGGGIVFQVNRVLLEAPTTSPEIHTQEGSRLYVGRAKLRDSTGAVDVSVLSTAVPDLFGLVDDAAVEAASQTDTLSTIKHRVNVRGVARNEEGAAKYLLVKITKWIPDETRPVSASAHAAMLGLATVHGDIVMPAPISSISKCPFLGMCLQRGDKQKVHAHRILVVVEGTCESDLTELKCEEETIFFVESKNVKCLLGGATTLGSAHLRGYCSMKQSLQYRLDEEVAVALVSAASFKEGRIELTVEHMQKLGLSSKDLMIASMQKEFEIAMGNEQIQTEESVRKCRRLEREPTEL